MKLNNNKKEILSLYVVQFLNIFVPLLTLPYLIQILGIENFGKVGYAQTLILIFCFLIDFGFNLSGARAISISKEKNNKFNHIYSTIIVIKFWIYFLLLGFGGLLIYLSNLNDSDKFIWLLASALSFSAVIIPNFLFNGLGINSVLAFISLGCRLFFLIPLFALVKKMDQYYLAIFLQFIPNIFIGIIALIYIHRKLGIRFDLKLFDRIFAFAQIKEAFHNFSASSLTLGFTYAIPLLVKGFLGDIALGLYTVVERLLTVLRQAYFPLIQTFYSKACVYYEKKDWLSYQTLIKKCFITFFAIGIVALATNYFFGSFIIRMFVNDNYNFSSYLNVGIITQIFISIAMILVNLYIIPIGQGQVLKKIYFFGLAIFFGIFYFMQNLYGLMGFYYTMLIVEIFITFCLIFVSYSYFKKDLI
ncbi:oligosaccharide flippase family protein [Acinetobacter bereziniae]|uniref:oligosaccharide flippase family protein n=1 Tax=Acinetobacter bereziniae TaxID=106648 RepID=UPI00190042BC|nr:oligosaccharide flippase family protein [Acinetobacter bereziniae]MBJ8553721.1 oligosaccharide flippase family protein [Acinetobacter bereziniae]